MTITSLSNLSAEELISHCDKHFGHELIVELAARFSKVIDQNDELRQENEKLRDEIDLLQYNNDRLKDTTPDLFE